MKYLLIISLLVTSISFADQRYYGWRFAPTAADLATPWVAPQGYVHASTGDMKSKPATDTPMNDITVWEPGWHRAPVLDDSIADNSEADKFAAQIHTEAVAARPSPSPSAKAQAAKVGH